MIMIMVIKYVNFQNVLKWVCVDFSEMKCSVNGSGFICW